MTAGRGDRDSPPTPSSLQVTASGTAQEAVTRRVGALVTESFASRLFTQDPTLWGPEAEAEAAKRLGWVDLARSSRPLVDQVAELRGRLAEAGIDRIVLCGMGGSSLAPEVICATHGAPLVVLDSSDPHQVRAALDDIDRTVVVVSSKSGSTVETDSQRRAFEAAYADARIDARQRILIVTDPATDFDQSSRDAGFRVVNADPEVGGRYSALTAFGLVPSGLAGADIGTLLDEAASVAELLAADDDQNPGLQLGAAIAGTDPLRDKLVLVDDGSGLPGFPAWAEQLIAESTGKSGTGILPVVVAGPDSPEVTDPPDDVTIVRLAGPGGSPVREGESSVVVTGSLGAQLLMWEVATAVAGRLLGINPFDQPDVESAKQAARTLLDAPPTATEPTFSDGPVSVWAQRDWLGDAASLDDALARLLEQVAPDRGYLAVMAYLDRLQHATLTDIREPLARRLGRPVTFGWGPRFLHSTGQLHKGGPPVGAYLQVTATPAEDLPIPGREFGFATLIAAQAAGDAEVLGERGRPVLRVHLNDVSAGLDRLVKVVEGHGSRLSG